MRVELGADLFPQVDEACRSLLDGSLGTLTDLQVEDLEAIHRSLAKLSTRLEGEPINWADHSESTHALRGPLNSIIGFSRLLLRGVDGPIADAQHQALETIYNGSRRMLVVFNLLLDASTLDQEGIRVTCETDGLQGLLDELTRVGQTLAESKGFAFEAETAAVPSGVRIYSDQSRLKQMLAGLLALIARYADQASLKLSAELIIEEQAVRIDVACTHCSFPQAAVQAYPQLLTDQADLTIPYDVHLRLGLARELLNQLGGQLDVLVDSGGLTRFVIVHPIV
jgi:signal transduction histidine kinase